MFIWLWQEGHDAAMQRGELRNDVDFFRESLGEEENGEWDFILPFTREACDETLCRGSPLLTRSGIQEQSSQVY